MRIVSREEASKVCDDYNEMLKKEKHHDHEIVEVEGVLRWKENKKVKDLYNLISLQQPEYEEINDIYTIYESI
jgi:hypothetical protein